MGIGKKMAAVQTFEMPPQLTTSLLVQAALAIANASMVSMVVVRRGDDKAGTIFVRLDHPDGTASLESRSLNLEGKYSWSVIAGDPPITAAAMQARLDREIGFDSDCWIVAIDSAIGDNPLRKMG